MKKLLPALALLFLAAKVNAQCTAAFTYTNTGNTYDFTDASTTASGNIVTWFWTFGDQTNPSTQQNPQHTYDFCGTFVVTLNIFTSSFCTATYSDTIVINSGFSASFTSTVDTTNGQTDFQATPSSTLLNYTWDFGDASTGAGDAPSHTYNVSGTYTVCLIVSDTGNICSDTVCNAVVVYIAPPTCNATFTSNNPNGYMEVFTASTFDGNWDYSWDFGDATTGTGFVTTHTYATFGTYTVCLTINDSSTGCSSTFCDTVTLAQATCNATFTNAVIGAGNESFTATPFTLGWTYDWDFGDATTGAGFFTTHQYTTSGTYTVCLTVSDSATSCTSTFCDTVNVVVPTSCPPTFTANGLNGTYIFTASPFSLQNTYDWDYGDATTGTGFVGNHTYTASGTYTVCLTMTTPSGCTGTFCDTINVTIIGVEKNGGALPFTLYPNPASQQLQADYFLAAASPVTIEVVDLAGRSLVLETSEHASGAQHQTIDVSSLAPGTYLLRIRTENGGVNKVFVKE